MQPLSAMSSSGLGNFDNRVLEDRAQKSSQIEEWRRICCAEADRARQLKYNELSTQQKENPSTVNQLMALKRCKRFSTLRQRAASQPVNIPSPRGMISRDSCFQLAARNSLGTTGHVEEEGTCSRRPIVSIFGNSKKLTTASCRSTPN